MKYLKIFTDFKEELELLTDAERGRLFMAMINYAESDEIPELLENERFVWPSAKRNIDRAREKADKCAESGRASGNARATNANERERTATNANERERTATNANERERTATNANERERTATNANERERAFLKEKEKEKISAYADISPLYPPMGKGESASAPEMERFSPVMQSAVKDWLAYKAEKRQAYKPAGLKAFFTEAESNARKYGDQKVADAIHASMAANYQGVVWDKAAGQSRASPAQRGDGWTYAGQRRYDNNDLAGIVIPLDGD